MKKLYFLVAITCLMAVSQLKAQTAPCAYFANCVNASRGAEAIGSKNVLAREAWYDVKFYWLDLNLNRNNSVMSGNVLVRAQAVVADIDTFSLELASQFTVDSVTASLNSAPFESAAIYTRTGSDLDINLPFTAHLNDVIETRVYYHGTAPTSSFVPSGGGFFTGTNHVFSASPPYNASTWWPCKQVLTDKADSSWFFITTDTSNTALANGVLTDKVSVTNSTNRWEWKSKYPIDFYLVAFVVGKYNKSTKYFHPTERTDSMIVEGYSRTNTPVDLPRTVDILEKFSDLFGLYPFYDEQLALADVTLGGGMENQTLIALGSSGTVIEHEVMHQWFGDHVTCGSYRDIWLNEGFARWGEALYAEKAYPSNPDSMRIVMCGLFETGDPIYGGSTIGAAANANANNSIYNYASDTNSINSLYGGTGRAMYYEKSAMMFNSLRFEVGNDSLFFLGMRNYITQYGGKTARGNNFIDVMENTTGMDMTDFFNSWYYGYGFPTFGIRWNHKNDNLALRITETTSSINTPLIKTSLEIKVRRFRAGVAADTTIRTYISQNVTEMNLPMGDSVTGFVIDPNQWIANKTINSVKDTNLVIGIETVELDKSPYEVFPNPASDYINIRTTAPVHGMIEAELYNSVGQRVQYSKVYANQPMKLNELPDGMYFLHIDKQHSYKIMVSH